MSKFRKKPVVIEAVRWTGDNHTEIRDFIPKEKRELSPEGLVIFTLEGNHQATIGDMIIKGVKEEFYPCKFDIFELTYEPVE